MKKYLLLSVKQQYTEQILQGRKTIELRKSKPSVSSGDVIIIYCTSPVKAIVGTATIEDVITHTPSEMWELHSQKLGITKRAFFEYYENSDKAIGIVMSHVATLPEQIQLSSIKQRIPTFSPPQTYRYFMKFVPAVKFKGFTLEPFRDGVLAR
ncbi:ASCH domain-containing protein [Parachryseolinea silvisoli]|uniref:ASCH domain-containing protein n=1 Tax=Parachryseolinea silvisoli TaxID=2873601 RepID=UPI0022657EB9|nr:ASCH domain-containing protein [Parachryseolinea silvisoli]MCD9019128.1 ASCH domain-containing protein [Parachryseolinea silvisoli]